MNLFKKKLNLIILILWINIGFAQSDSLHTEYVSRTETNYQSFEVVDSRIIAVNDNGQIVIWDIKTFDTIHFPNQYINLPFTSVSKDNLNQIFVANHDGNIYKLNPTDLSLSLYKKNKYRVNSICFNSENKMFLITPFSIYEPSRKKHWGKFKDYPSSLLHRKKLLGLFWVKTNTYFSVPEHTYLDKKGRWWMYKNYGEWGSDIQIFDTDKERIYTEKFLGENIHGINSKSIFEDNSGNLFITYGLHHISFSGKILKIDTNNIVSVIFDGLEDVMIEQEEDTSTRVEIDSNGTICVIAKRQITITPNNDLFVGPGTYNEIDNYIYFASNRGFYKALLPSEGKLPNPELFLSPTLTWNRSNTACGYEMAIKRILFTDDNKLLFLTSNDGFGIYDGQKLMMLK